MIVRRNKPGTSKPYNVDLVNSAGNTDFILGGKLYKNSTMHTVLVTAESDLSGLTGKYEPGTIAYTAGFGSMWQLDAAGTWNAIIEEG